MDKQRIPWVKSPCRGCGERSAECHATCEEYKKYAEFVKLRKLGYTEYAVEHQPTHGKKLRIDRYYRKEAKKK